MNGTTRVLLIAVTLFATSIGPRRSQAETPVAGDSLPQVSANDNSVPGGRLARGVLHLALVAQRGLFYPDGPGTLGLPIEALGEEGKPLQVPGPFLRVPLGTRVDATIRNDLNHELTIRG